MQLKNMYNGKHVERHAGLDYNKSVNFRKYF